MLSSRLRNINLKLQRRSKQVMTLLNPEIRENLQKFQSHRSTFYQAYWLKVAKNIGAEIDNLGDGYFRLCKNSVVTYVRGEFVMLDNHLVLKLSGNKPIIHKMLTGLNIPVPRYCTYDLQSMSRAQNMIDELGGEFVVKPAAETGGGKGVTTSISNMKMLGKASLQASVFSRNLMIEEQVPGDSYRLLYLNGELLDVIRRDPPIVTGDGKSSIKQLMKKETQKRVHSMPLIALHPLDPDLECQFTLAKQGLSLSSTPKKGEVVTVKHAPNQNSCYENHIVKDQIHPSIVRLGRDLASMFGIELAGVDLITPDISVPLSESKGVINEINSTPGLHHHYLVAKKDKRARIGEVILNKIFDSQQKVNGQSIFSKKSPSISL
ncbi:MAG: cyanophycin synthetase [Gammaproteobacteria bacterium]|nr:cyanophycin synthetase [Gammaproteobacteria bacterium]